MGGGLRVGCKAALSSLWGWRWSTAAFPGLAVPTRAGVRCLHPGGGGMGAQCPCITSCLGLWTALGCSVGSRGCPACKWCFCKMLITSLESTVVRPLSLESSSAFFSLLMSYFCFQNISRSRAPSLGCGNIQVRICSVWAGLSPAV